MSHSERWLLGMKKLRKNKWLEMKPDNWNTYYFDYGINAYDMRALAYAMQATKENRL